MDKDCIYQLFEKWAISDLKQRVVKLENEEGAIPDLLQNTIKEPLGANSSFHLLSPFEKNKAFTNEAAAVLTLGLITV